jgi:hypothetical protein
MVSITIQTTPMNHLLALGAIAIMMTACANLSPGSAGNGSAAAQAAATAEALGYHGPVHRASPRGD